MTSGDGGRGGEGTIAETTLDNGVRVLTERIPGVRSASTGVWVRHGASHDPETAAGASHLLEHMVFKGTLKRSARELALSLEALGGSLDAYTSREHTSYQARVLDQHLPVALEVLADLTLGPLLRDEDLVLEREVVLEEIAQVEDTPDDLVFELHGARLWRGHPYGRSILGSAQTVASLDGATLRDLHKGSYRGRNLIVAAAGNVDHEGFARMVEEHFGRIDSGDEPPSLPAPADPIVGDERVERDTAQSHVVFGSALPAHSDPGRYGLVLLSTALGAGMSSRLFQRIREELGLCYSVFTYQSFYAGRGVGGVYVGTRPATEDRAVDAIRDELGRVATEGLGADELEQVKQQVKGQVMLSLESTSARLYRLTGFALHDEPFLGLDEVLRRLDAVSVDEVAQLADAHFHPARQLVIRLGPV
jgi:predicted Zn-dependent peptidase